MAREDLSLTRERNQEEYYHFHKDHGHDTNKCFYLKEQIEALIQQGRLQKLVVERPLVRQENTCQDLPTREERRLEGTIGEIRVIAKGLAKEGESSSVRKFYVRKIYAEREWQLLTTERSTK